MRDRSGKESIRVFNRILKESDAAKLDLAAVLILDRKQTDLEAEAISHARGAVMYLPLKMKDLIDKLEELTPDLQTRADSGEEG